MPDSGASAHEADISEVLRQDVVGEGLVVNQRVHWSSAGEIFDSL